MLKRIGAEEGGEFKAVASGTLPSGRPVAVNSDGTVSVVAETTIAQSAGTPVNFESGNTLHTAAAYDANAGKVVIVYEDSGNSSHGTAIVGTVSGTSISFGTATVFEAAEVKEIAISYDTNAQKVLITYVDEGNSNYGTAIVGTVSGTSISFGTAVVIKSAATSVHKSVYDSDSQKIVCCFGVGASSPQAAVATISGTSVSFGTLVSYGGTNDGSSYQAIAYDTNAQKIVLAYNDGSNNYGHAIVGTVSGTSISFGSETTFNSAGTEFIAATYDASVQKVIIVYRDAGNSDKGTAIVATVSGTSISFGSEVIWFNSSNPGDMEIVYDTNAEKIIITYRDGSTLYGTIISGKASGTSITFDSPLTIQESRGQNFGIAYDSTNKKVVIAFQDHAASAGDAVVFTTGFTSTNLTSENYIGMSRGVVNVDSRTQAVGSAVVFESGNAPQSSIVYDSTNNKVVIAFRDVNNSNYSTGIVGTVSGTSISFGTPVVYSSSSTAENRMAFDSNSGKVVIAYYDGGNTNYGTAVVGTVSGTSISFGTPVVYNSGNATVNNAITFDSNSNKVVIAYKDQPQSDHGKAIVGTVSGTSISFGTEVTFNSAGTDQLSATFDSSNNKVVIVFQDTGGNSGYGSAIVGTVSGTSISFGSKVAYTSANSPNNAVTFDTTNNKVVAFYEHDGTGLYGIVGTVSGTSISFGTAVQFTSSTDGQWSENSATFDSSSGKVALAYQDTTNSKGRLIAATVSGTSLTFDDPIDLFNNASQYTSAAYDSSNEKIVVSVRDTTPDGQAIVVSLGFTNITRAEVADGGNASMDIIGSVSTNQNSLTAGQQYYVQTDGTISTTAGDPSVLAGTAISATELVVKT